MTKFLKFLSIPLFALLVILPSCYNIEEMSDFNEIHTFDIVSFSSETIDIAGVQRPMQLGGADIVDGSVIYIDIVFGEHLFPLHFYANPIINGEIDRIVGVDFSVEQVLETRDCEIRFYVIAISGLSRVYTIRPRVVPLNENTSIRNFFQIINVEPAMIVSEQGIITGDTLKIFTVGGRGPVTITPKFYTIADSTYFSEITSPTDVVQLFANGEMPLSFNRPEDVHRLRVVSQSGIESTWHIMVYHTPLATGVGQGADLDERDVSTSSQTENFEVHSTFVDGDAGEILLTIRDVAAQPTAFPLEVVVLLDIPSGSQVFGLENAASFARTSTFSARLVFEAWDDVHTFYLLDRENQISRKWSVVLQELKSSANMVLDFEHTFEASTVTFWSADDGRFEEGPAATLDIERMNIVSRGIDAGDIFLAMIDVNNAHVDNTHFDNWELTLNIEHINVSDRATIGELPSFVWTGNGGWATPQSFTVTAQDGSVRTWHVHIEDVYNRVAYSDAELLEFEISSYLPTFVVFDADDPVTLDSDERIVTLNLTDDYNVYPLQVWFTSAISTRAQIVTQNNGTGPLVFQNENDTQTITIRAEDGTTLDWTVRLQPPARSTEATVVTFNVSAVSAGFSLANTTTTIHPETREIRIKLTTPAPMATPPIITYAMTVSYRATTPFSLGGQLNFSSFRHRHTFRITAEDGTTTEDWTIRLIYEPQLFNWNLDSWSSGSAPINVFPHGWATANFTAVIAPILNTTQVAGRSGSAAQLRTNPAPIVNQPGAGSLFLGRFNAAGAVTHQGDPIRITEFGLPFGTSGHIRGISVDVKFQAGATFIPGTTYHELGSATIELVKPNPALPGAEWVYHGHHTDGRPHFLNTAIRVANSEMLFGNTPGVAWTGDSIKVVSPTEWTTVEILFDFPGGVMPDFTQLHVVFSSSARGDLFQAVNGSTLTIDNIRILYKEED